MILNMAIGKNGNILVMTDFSRLFPLFLTHLLFEMMRIVIIILVGLFYYGCNNSEEYDFKGKVPESRLVLYVYAETDSLLYAEVLKSRTYTDNSEIDSTWDVKGLVYMNDRYAGELKHVGHNRYSSNICPKSGDKVTVKVSCPGLGEAIGSTVVCNSFPEIKLDTFSKMNTLQLRVRIKDGGETENYYRLVVENKMSRHEILWKEGQIKIDSSTTYSYNVDLSGDEILSHEMISTILGKEINTNPYQVFTNESFRGKERIIHASINHPYAYERETWMITGDGDTIRYVEKESYRLRVKVLRLDKPLFDFLYTLGIQEKQPSMYKEPVKVYSNVQGGLGVVGSCFTREVIMDFPAK